MRPCSTLFVLCAATFPVVCVAQPAGPPAESVSATQSIPVVTIGAEAGHLLQTETNAFARPIWMPTVQLALGRRAVLQVEWSHWADGGASIRASRIADALGGPLPVRGNDLVGVARLTVTTFGGSLLYRVGSSRAAGFAGGGVNAQRLGHELFGRAQVGCVPALPSSLCISLDPDPTIIQTMRVRPQVIAGGEVALAGPVRAVGTVRVQFGDRDPAATFTGGLRVAVRTRRELPAPLAEPLGAVGTETRIVGLDGITDVGRLVALTPTSVVFNRGDGDISRPLTEVRRIERVSRNVRRGALIGLVTGAVLSFVIGCDTGGDDCSNRLAMVPFTLPLFGGIGVGTGAGIGAMVNAARRERNLLYLR